MKLKLMFYALILSFSPIDLKAYYLSEPISVSRGSGDVYQRNRSLGENDLINLSDTVCQEDLWIFLSNKWYDIGIEETRGTVMQDDNLIETILSNTTGDVIEYHIHAHEWCPNYDEDFITLEPMSYTDILANIYLSKKVNAHNNRTLISKIADEHGIWTYSITDEARANILNNNLETIETLRSALSRRFSNLDYVPKASLQERLDLYLRRLQEIGVNASYQKMR